MKLAQLEDRVIKLFLENFLVGFNFFFFLNLTTVNLEDWTTSNYISVQYYLILLYDLQLNTIIFAKITE